MCGQEYHISDASGSNLKQNMTKLQSFFIHVRCTLCALCDFHVVDSSNIS